MDLNTQWEELLWLVKEDIESAENARFQGKYSRAKGAIEGVELRCKQLREVLNKDLHL